MKHISVLLNESIEGLNIKESGIYVDCTLGFAGHSKEILKRIRRGCLFAFDQDEIAVNASEKTLSEIGSNYKIINTNFVNLKQSLKEYDISGVDGILFDLGVSSPQLDVDERGFSYHNDAPLDMRMDKRNKLSAYDVVNNYTQEELVNIFFKYGEEEYARSIARKIIDRRNIKPIKTTLELANIISESVPAKRKRKSHPGGRICVITFHSLEDRICKQIFKEYSDIDEKVKGLPVIPDEYKPTLKLIGKAIKPTEEEVAFNNRSRSATLRIAEKL